MPSFQFNVEIEGLAQSLIGDCAENGSIIQGTITPIGLLTQGFVIGKADFWTYSDTPANPSWALSETVTNPNWVLNDT